MPLSRVAAALLLALPAALAVQGCQGGKLNSDEDAPVVRPAGVSEENARLAPRTSPLKVGGKTPEFGLADQNGNLVSAAELSSGKGAFVIFVPRDAAPGSRPAWEHARRAAKLSQQRGIEVLLVTPENPATNATIAQREGLRLAVLSDPGSWVARSFGIVGKGGGGPASPWSFVLGPDGRIHFSERGLAETSAALMAAETLPGTQERGAIPLSF